MNVKKPHFINFGGSLMDVSTPRVMGILNVTPDSFYSGSRTQTSKQIAERVEQLRNEGADIIDIGACSTRPGSEQPTIDEEMNRLQMGLKVVQDVWPEAILSVDTYRSKVAQMCVEEYGVAMVNDIAAGQMDEKMFPTVARLGVPYVLMHMQGTPETMQQNPHYDNLFKEICLFFAERINRLRQLGVKDIIIAYDKEFDNFASQEARDYYYKLEKICRKYINYCNFYFLFDFKGLLGMKDAPIDRGKEIFEKLMKNKIQVRLDNDL